LLTERQYLVLTARVLIGELSRRDRGSLPQLNRQWEVIADVRAVTAAEEPAPRHREQQESNACPEDLAAPWNAWKMYPHKHRYTEITPRDTTEPSGLTPSGLQLTG
jgi:hypothetical protein